MDVCKKMTSGALEVGFRLIDTASVYKNESFIGELLEEEALKRDHGLRREDVFITTKVGPKDQGKGKCRESVLQSLEKLRVDSLDMVLIHWPGTSGVDPSDERNSVLRKESWSDLEHLYKESKIKAIGVSNYTQSHLQELLAHCSVVPAVNQVEFHPLLFQEDLLHFCRSANIHVQAYSSLGSAKGWEILSANPVIREVALTSKKTIAQILLKWALNHGLSVIPKTSKMENLKTNFDLGSFDLTPEEMAKMDSLNTNHRFCWNPESIR